jgi:hypothetical protein
LALVPMLVYALPGTSRPLSVSTSSTVSLLTCRTIGALDRPMWLMRVDPVPRMMSATGLPAAKGVLMPIDQPNIVVWCYVFGHKAPTP